MNFFRAFLLENALLWRESKTFKGQEQGLRHSKYGVTCVAFFKVTEQCHALAVLTEPLRTIRNSAMLIDQCDRHLEV